MTLISTNVPSLVNGVSQQADSLRYPSQCDGQLNGLSSIIDGLTKRPPLNYVARLCASTDYSSPTFHHHINRSPSEQYTVLVSGGSTPALRVFDLDGDSIPVKNAAGALVTAADLAYLTTDSPAQSLVGLTVADYTLLLNRDIPTEQTTALTETATPGALIFVKQFKGAMKISMKVWSDPVHFIPDYTWTLEGSPTYSDTSLMYEFTGNGTNVPYAPLVDAHNPGTPLPTFNCADQGDVMESLATLFTYATATTTTFGDIFAWSVEDSLMHLKKLDDTPFRVEVSCSYPEAVYAFQGSVQNYALLPKRGWVGFQLCVRGDPDEAGDDYYIEYRPTDPAAVGFATGFWEETHKPGITYQLDAATMPHALLNYGDHFVFKPLEWGERLCGDDTSNPPASFVGKPLRNIFFWKNRMGFLSGENVILSEAGEFFNFWRTTVVTLLDSELIDVGVSHNRVSLLNAAVPNSEKLVLFSDQTQFTLQGAELLSPKTVSINQTTEYETHRTVAPLPLGNAIFLPFSRGPFGGLLEYSIQTDSALYAGFDVSAHVPHYLLGSITKLVGSETDGILIALTSGLESGCYVYRYFTRGQQRLMSSWSTWTFGPDCTVLDAFFVNTRLYFVLSRADGVYLEYLDVAAGQLDYPADFVVLLDHRITEAKLLGRTYDADTGLTTLTLPYPNTSGVEALTRITTTPANGGQRLPCTPIGENQCTLRGDYTTASLWIGTPYTLRYTMTKPTLRASDATGNLVVNPGRFQVRRGLLAYDNALFFRVEVTPKYRPTITHSFTGSTLGVGTSYFDVAPACSDGVFAFPVYSKNDQVKIELVNDTPYPSNFLSVDWEALYVCRSLRQ